jgi:hypothetical protein
MKKVRRLFHNILLFPTKTQNTQSIGRCRLILSDPGIFVG